MAPPTRILLLYAASPQTRMLSYQAGWPKHFLRHPRFECVPLNVLERRPLLDARALRALRRPLDAVVILHSVFSNGQYLTGRLLDRVAALPVPKAYFVGNEYKLMPAKIAFCEEVGVGLVVSQLGDPAARDLYRQRLGVEVAAIPSGGLDLDVFDARTPRPERPIDVGYRAFRTAPYLGHHEREQLAEAFAEAAARRGLRADISLELADRLVDEPAWAGFLDGCRGQLGSEAGADFFELTDETRARVGGWAREHPEATAPEILERFFASPPGGPSGRALSGRVVEAAGTRTVQLLLEGAYGGYFEPNVHYIPVRKDLADVDEALDRLEDGAETERLVAAAHEVAVGELTYARLIDRFHDALAGLL